MVIYLHCEILLAAKDTIQSPVSQRKHNKHHSDDTVNLDSLGRYVDFNPSPYIITVPRRKPQAPKNPYKRQIYLDYAVDLDSSSQYADSLPLSLPVSKRKPKKYLDDLNNSQRYVNQSQWYIPTRKSPTSLSNSPRHHAHSDDMVDLDNLGLYVDSVLSPYILSVPNRKSQTAPNKPHKRRIHSDNKADLRRYADWSPHIFTVP